MGRLEQEERHALLPLSSSNSSNSTTLGSSSEDIINSDNENRVEFQEKTKYFRKKLAVSLLSGGHTSKSSKSANTAASSAILSNNRRKLHSNRGLGKRFTRFLFCAFMIPMSLFLILYSSLFSTSSSRHCKFSVVIYKYVNHGLNISNGLDDFLCILDHLPDWDFDVSRNISDYVLPLNDTTILEPRQKCSEKFFLLIIVCSGLNNFEAR